jgi:ABC-type transporter Mla MlaB component
VVSLEELDRRNPQNSSADEFSLHRRSFSQMVHPPQTTVAFAIEGPIGRADLPGLCDRVCALLERSGAGVAVCDVSGVEVDAVTVDALARLQLAVRRKSCQVRLRGASGELQELVAFMGLTDVLPG